MKKFKKADFAFLLCVYLAVAFFPLNYFDIPKFVIQIIGISLRIAYLVFIIIYLCRRNVFKLGKINVVYTLLLLPCFIACFSNEIVATCAGEIKGDVVFKNFYLDVILSLLTVLCEELIFRMAGFKIFESKTPFIRIILTSTIFGIAHLFNFFSSFNPLVFVQAIYTFGIGIILGLLYEFGGNIGFSILFHLLFNVFNNDLFNLMYVITSDLQYYLINVLIGACIGVYCLLIYLLVFRKKEVKENVS